MPDSGQIRWQLLDGLLLILAGSLFAVYGDVISPRFYEFLGFATTCLGFYFLFGSPFRRLAKQHNARPGFIVLGIAAFLLGFSTMSAKGIPSWRTPSGKIGFLGVVAAFVGSSMIAIAAKKRGTSQDGRIV